MGCPGHRNARQVLTWLARLPGAGNGAEGNG